MWLDFSDSFTVVTDNNLQTKVELNLPHQLLHSLVKCTHTRFQRNCWTNVRGSDLTDVTPPDMWRPKMLRSEYSRLQDLSSLADPEVLAKGGELRGSATVWVMIQRRVHQTKIHSYLYRLLKIIFCIKTHKLLKKNFIYVYRLPKLFYIKWR